MDSPGRPDQGREGASRAACSSALAILNDLLREAGNPFVFIGQKRGGLTNMAMDAILHHGLQGAADGARLPLDLPRLGRRDDRLSQPCGGASLSARHRLEVEAAYRRSDLFDKRRRLMADWARYASTPGAKRSFATVSPIRGGGR